MVMLPPGTKESYAMKCPSCGFSKIIHGEFIIFDLLPFKLIKKIKTPICPECGGKLIKDDSIIIAH